MKDDLGQARFCKWKADPRENSFASRLLKEWLQWRCGCTQRVAAMAMASLPSTDELEDLVASVFVFMGVENRAAPTPPRYNSWRKSANFGGSKPNWIDERHVVWRHLTSGL